MSELKFLIVEDSPVVRLTLRTGLIHEKVRAEAIWEADSTRRAIEVYDEVRPDVVLLDVNLPEGPPANPAAGSFLDFLTTPTTGTEDGSTIARHMVEVNPKLKIVVCTGNSPSDPRVRELIQGGAFLYLQKPVHLPKIRELVEQLRRESD